ncbi:hypothetical protein BGZ58_001266 [Dissophora ornata]|nr:hypothetical protein BGZ58_001266 [Dissophora ornata]
MDKALEIPEIRSAIARFLGRRDMSSCILISRAWWSTCSVLLWQHIRFGLGFNRQPSLQAFEQNGHHIRELMLGSVQGLDAELEHCSNLTTLRLVGHRVAEDSLTSYMEVLSQLISRNHSTLRVFESDPAITPAVLRAVLSCPRLEVLETTTTNYDEEVSDQFLRMCGQLKRFVSAHDCMGLVKDAVGLPGLVFPNITALSFKHPMLPDDAGSEFVPHFIAKCPQLRSLEWNFDEPFPTRIFVEETLPACTKLESFTLCNPRIEDGEVAQVLDAMTQVKLFNVRGSVGSRSLNSFGSASYLALQRHFATLETIDLRGIAAVDSHVQEVLSACPNLRVIAADEIWAKDILDGAPWVCMGLRVFRVCIMGVADSFIEAVFGQLSRLHQLYELDIGRAAGVTDGLALTLGAGLGRLAGLTRLRYVSVVNTDQTMGAEDVEWVVQHWRLTTWEGMLHIDRKQHEARAEQLRQSGILFGVYSRREMAVAQSRLDAFKAGR